MARIKPRDPRLCTAITQAGNECARFVIEGTTLCYGHTPRMKKRKPPKQAPLFEAPQEVVLTDTTTRWKKSHDEAAFDGDISFSSWPWTNKFIAPIRKVTIVIDDEPESTVSGTVDKLSDVIEAFLAAQSRMRTFEQRPRAPIWVDYDVIGLTRQLHSGATRTYTYMRENGHWPGNRSWSTLRDDQVNEAFRAGKVVHLARNGRPV